MAIAALKAVSVDVKVNGNVATFRGHDDLGNGTLDLLNGKLTHDSGLSATDATQALKRAISREVVKQSAIRNGWQLKETAPNKFQVFKRF